jgi:hypothetical protein
VSRFSRPAWLTTGLLIGAVAVPAFALGATGQLVTITGGHNASVSAGGQLRTVEMDPANIVHGSAFSSGACAPLAVAPANRALIIKQINVNAEAVVGTASVVISSDPACAGDVAAADLPQRGLTSIPLGPGIPVRAGTGLYVHANGAGSTVQVDALGYSITPSALPAGIAAEQHIGSASGQRTTKRR